MPKKKNYGELIIIPKSNDPLDSLDRDPLADFIFDDSKVYKPIKSAVGLLHIKKNLKKDNDDVLLYYFGRNIPKNKLVPSKKTGGVKQIEAQVLCLICDDGSLIEIDEDTCTKLRIRVSDPPILKRNYWSLEQIGHFVRLYASDGFDIINPKKIFNMIVNQYKKYNYYDDDLWYEVNAIWDIGTYFFTLFDAYPYMESQGIRGTGKSKTMHTSNHITFNATSIITDPNIARLIRQIECNKPTLYLDEMEKLIIRIGKNTETSEVVELLNHGWQVGGTIQRLDKGENNRMELKEYDVYCPKRIASINGLDGIPATQDRCITQIHIRPPIDDNRHNIWPVDNSEFAEIRNYLYPFALHYWKEVHFNYHNLSISTSLRQRDLQIWKPLLSIATLIDEKLGDRLKKFAEEQTEIKQTLAFKDNSIELAIMNSIITIIDTKDDDKPFEMTIAGIRENLELPLGFEKRPTPQYIGGFINKIGFKKYRKRHGTGVFYLLTKTDALKILQSVDKSITLITPNQKKPVIVEKVHD